MLWIGDPAVLPLDGWALPGEDGVAYATSRNGAPDVTDLWPGPPSAATRSMGDVISIARAGGTARLGRLLAPMAVRYIVVPKRLSTGASAVGNLPVPASLTRALGSQLDLRLLPSDPSLDVYENVSWGPARAELADAAAAPPAALDAGADLSGGQPVLGGSGPVRFAGQLPAPGRVLLSEAPSGRWELTVGGRTAARTRAFGVANVYTTGQAGSAHVRYRTPLWRWPLAVVPYLLWAGAVSVLLQVPAPPGSPRAGHPAHAGPGRGRSVIGRRRRRGWDRGAGAVRPGPAPVTNPTPDVAPVRRTRRAPALIVLVAVLVAGGLVDRRSRAASGESASISAQVPVAAPVSARSSAWYCPGGLAGNPAADASVVVANAGTRHLSGTVTVFGDKGDSHQAPIDVNPASRTSVRLADVVTAGYAAAVVELDGGDAVAETVASGSLGDSVTQCASSASSSWYFAEGSTTKDATETLLALNPFPDDAVVDIVFSTEEGLVSPQALTGLLLKGQALTAINVGDFVQRRESVSVSLVARTGRLVVGRLQTFDGTGTSGRKGISIGLGAAAAGPAWYFPEGLTSDGLAERFQVYNPSKQEAQVQVSLTLDAGEAEPLQLTVPRESRVTVVANDETRIPKSVGHSVTVRTTSGPDVVVERSVDGASPSSRTGLSIALGARLPATRWATAAGAGGRHQRRVGGRAEPRHPLGPGDGQPPGRRRAGDRRWLLVRRGPRRPAPGAARQHRAQTGHHAAADHLVGTRSSSSVTATR